MKRPEVLLVPAFMIADYYLTVVGALLREKGYSKHFQSEHYELNPAFQKVIQEKRWFSPRHFILTILVSLLLIFLSEWESLDPWMVELCLGLFLVMFGLVLGRHICNILIFRAILRNPTEISGQVHIDHAMLLSWSLYQFLGAAIPLAIIAGFSPTPFNLGGSAGALLLLGHHLSWARKYRKQRQRQEAKAPEIPE